MLQLIGILCLIYLVFGKEKGNWSWTTFIVLIVLMGILGWAYFNFAPR